MVKEIMFYERLIIFAIFIITIIKLTHDNSKIAESDRMHENERNDLSVDPLEKNFED